MKICFVIVANNTTKAKENYEKISAKFTGSNSSISTEYIDDIFSLKSNIDQLGCSFDKIVTVVFSEKAIGNLDDFSDAIVDIASMLNKNQDIIVCDTKNVLSGYLSEAMIEHEDNLKYSVIEPKINNIYEAVFGGKMKKDNFSAEKVISDAIKRDKESEDEEPAPVDDDDDSVPAPIDEDEPKQTKKEKKPKSQKSGLRDKISGLFNKKKAREEVKSIANGETDTEELIPVPEDENEEMIPVQEEELEETYEEEEEPVINNRFNKKDEAEEDVEVNNPPMPDFNGSFFGDDDDEDEDEDEDEPYYNEDDDEEEEEEFVAPPPKKNKSMKKKEPEVIEPEVAPKQRKGGFFGKNKIDLPKVDKKAALSMQTRPRIIFVTGTGRIGQTTLTASLGFVAGQSYCKTLIVDMDMIRRGISCIYPDYTNPNSNQSIGLLSALHSPHLVDDIATEQFDNVYTLDIPITFEDNRGALKSVTAAEVQTMLLQALTKFNFIVVDMPWDYLMNNKELMSIPADILFCTSNDVMTIISDLSNLTEDAFEDNEKEKYQMLLSKLSFVLNMTQSENKYGSKAITDKNFTKVCYQLTEDEMLNTIPVIANIPVLPGIGNQVVFNKPASAYSNEFAAFCFNILQNLK